MFDRPVILDEVIYFLDCLWFYWTRNKEANIAEDNLATGFITEISIIDISVLNIFVALISTETIFT